MTTSIRQKIALVFLGLFLSLVLLEVGMRLGGFVLLSIQECGNLRSIKQKNAYRILCLGESTTQGQYPHLLEQVLNQRNIGVHFSVVDKGKRGVNTRFILGQVESYLTEYRPNMVVAMMGSNDRGEHIPYDKATASKGMLLIRSFKIYKLTRFLELHLLAKAKEMGFYKPDKDRQSAMKTQTYLSEIGLKETSEMSHLTEKSPEKVMESNPKNNNAQVRFGELYRGQGKFHEAEDSFKKAIEIDPKNDEAYVGFGYFYQKRGKLSQAEDSFKKAIEIDPKNDRAWVGLGWLYKGKGQGKFSQAEDAFKKAIEINPQNELAYVELGQLYQVQGEFSKAGDSFKKAIEIDPKNDEAYVGLGFFYNQLGKFTQAEESFKKASGLNPGNDRAFFELGWLYRTQGKFFQAIDFFKKDMEFHPNDGRALSAIASLYEELGKPELAKEYAEKAKLLGSGLNAAVAVNNYRKLKKILDRKGIQLVCVQYPMRNVEMLKRIFGEDEGVIFVDNEQVFKKAVRPSGYKEYFTDMFAGDFGHCTQKGNELLAQNIADVILSEVFNK